MAPFYTKDLKKIAQNSAMEQLRVWKPIGNFGMTPRVSVDLKKNFQVTWPSVNGDKIESC